MNVPLEFFFAFIIGRGLGTPGPFVRVGAFLLSLLLGWMASDSRVQVRPRFSHGKGPSMSLNKAERIIFFVAAVIFLLLALGVMQ